MESEFTKMINETESGTGTVRDTISRFAAELSKHITKQQAKIQLLKINDMQNGNEVMKGFFELAVKCNIEMPIELATALKEERGFAKQFLVAELWNRVCEKEGEENG